MFLRKGVQKICSKFTGDHIYRSTISIKLQSNFSEIALWHGFSPVNLLNIFRTPFPRNTPGWLLLTTRTAAVPAQEDNPVRPVFLVPACAAYKIIDAKLYISVVTLSTQDDNKLLQD